MVLHIINRISRFVSNLNFHRSRIMNNCGAATFEFAGSKIWEKIPSKLKKNLI